MILLQGGSTIDVEAERKESQSTGVSVLGKMRSVIEKEISSVLKQLKDNQVSVFWVCTLV